MFTIVWRNALQITQKKAFSNKLIDTCIKKYIYVEISVFMSQKNNEAWNNYLEIELPMGPGQVC